MGQIFRRLCDRFIFERIVLGKNNKGAVLGTAIVLWIISSIGLAARNIQNGHDTVCALMSSLLVDDAATHDQRACDASIAAARSMRAYATEEEKKHLIEKLDLMLDVLDSPGRYVPQEKDMP